MPSRGDLTTISVNKGTLERLKDIKPFQSMSYEELLNDMADQYESE